MKKAKLTLGLITSLVSTGALAACQDVTAKDGVVLTFTDAQGLKVDYTAEELFGDYHHGTSAASTDFNQVEEVLIRKYYSGKPTLLAAYRKEAQNKVNGIKTQAETNAGTNGTKYQVEFQKLLESNGVKNIDELLDKKLYEVEKEHFEEFYESQDNVKAMRDGVDKDGNAFFPESTVYGKGSKGYIEERLPYHVSHVLVKTNSASAGNYTQATISEGEARNLSLVVKEIAGAKVDDPKAAADVREEFGDIAMQYSEDDGSKKEYGDLGIMDKKESYVPEFKLGLFAYDALYNQADRGSYANDRKANLLPTDDAEVLGDKVSTFMENQGIGQIPYGVFAMLGKENIAKDPDLGYTVNENSSTFYARNILFNKYLNKHQIAVITPNSIPLEAYPALDGTVAYNKATEADTTGTLDANYAALPGFSVDTSSQLPGIGSNVLTNKDGKIVFAARAGGGSYQGIHFIVVDRSPLSQFGSYVDSSNKIVEYSESDVASNAKATTFAEYYTMTKPGDTDYPKTEAGDAKSTYINPIITKTANYDDRVNKVTTRVKGYNANKDTYMFQYLMENSDGATITFHDEDVEKLITSYIVSKRDKTAYDDEFAFDKEWTTYAETLLAQEEARELKDDGSQKLISEVCAIGYGTEDARKGEGVWGKGGACYNGGK